MTEPNGGGGGSASAKEAAAGLFPTGLNRIKTRRAESNESYKSFAAVSSRLPPPSMMRKPKPKPKAAAAALTREEFRKGKKIARWLKSYFSMDASQLSDDLPEKIEKGNLEAEVLNRSENGAVELSDEGNPANRRQIAAESVGHSKGSKGLKSFSHELGPKGGMVQAHYPRAHSYSDLKELLGSLQSRFDAAKEVVNAELAGFAADIMDFLEKGESTLQVEQTMAEDLLVLVQLCMEMTCSQFRAKCAAIVHDLTEKRQQCQTGLLKWLFTRMLFILTRCTRVLQFQKDVEPIDELSLRKFKRCLENVPSIEKSWETNHGIADSEPACALDQIRNVKPKCQGQSNLSSLPEASCCGSARISGRSELTSKMDSLVFEPRLPSEVSKSDALFQGQKFHLTVSSVGNYVNNSSCSSLHEQGQSSDDSFQEGEQVLGDSDSVICRICEEAVPISHLESHSYICAYADKCDLNCLDVDERLSNLAEILDQIVESRNTNFHSAHESPENLRVQLISSITAEGYSPKVSEWRNKGVEGMFEDIHEMDTASIDDSHLSSTNLKGHLGIKLCNNGAPSSSGSMTSVSSTNTPRAGHFDSFWLERNNPSDLEDVRQMIDLADIARCVASTDISKEGSYEFLLACLQDLQEVLQCSKLKALVIDTFGGRIEKLLRDKYIIACDMMDTRSPTSDSKYKENTRHLLDNVSQSSAGSTPVHSSHKERTSIDDFEIIKPISRGAYGKVFLARKRTTGDLFAIKVLKKLDMLRKNDVQRILAERNILIAVRNPFVVRFYYSFTCSDNLYLVMEYLNGGDLYSLLRKVGCLEEDIARIYIAELVLALEYLHSLGIVHRDLKPDNILIAHDGHIKLTDFGLSKIGLINSTLDLSAPETKGFTTSNAFNLHNQQTEDVSHHSAVGTPDYLAPEILLGTEHGFAVDWWSVGIILFELITGIPPFSAELPEIIFDNILNRKIPWPAIPTDMSYEAQDLINRLLTHDPSRRIGANGSTEVKAHPFFRGVDWDNLALQKAAFVPNPDSADDTSYFVSRFSQMNSGMLNEPDSSPSDTGTYDLSSDSGDEMDECPQMAEFDSSSLNLSLINFSFKNLSQLASINHDVLLQTGKDSTKSTLSSRPPET